MTFKMFLVFTFGTSKISLPLGFIFDTRASPTGEFFALLKAINLYSLPSTKAFKTCSFSTSSSAMISVFIASMTCLVLFSFELAASQSHFEVLDLKSGYSLPSSLQSNKFCTL